MIGGRRWCCLWHVLLTLSLLTPPLLLCDEAPPEYKHQAPGEELDQGSEGEAGQHQGKHGLGQTQLLGPEEKTRETEHYGHDDTGGSNAEPGKQVGGDLLQRAHYEQSVDKHLDTEYCEHQNVHTCDQPLLPVLGQGCGAVAAIVIKIP